MSNNDRNAFIDQLTDNLQAVKPVNMTLITLYWLMGASVFSLSIIRLVAPYRSGASVQLISSPQFLVESLIGVLAICLLIYTAFQMVIPSPMSLNKRLKWPLILFIVWIGFYFFGFMSPALEPSSHGMRAHCDYQTFIFSLPALITGVYWANKQWPTSPVSTGFVIGLASGAIPALIMQFSCMYDPSHILTAHVLPGVLVGVLGGFLGLTGFIKPATAS